MVGHCHWGTESHSEQEAQVCIWGDKRYKKHRNYQFNLTSAPRIFLAEEPSLQFPVKTIKVGSRRVEKIEYSP